MKQIEKERVVDIEKNREVEIEKKKRKVERKRGRGRKTKKNKICGKKDRGVFSKLVSLQIATTLYFFIHTILKK